MTRDPRQQQPHEIAADAQRLLATWERLASTHAVIGGGGCACCGGGVAVSLAEFEQDIIDFILSDAERARRPDVVSLLQGEARDGKIWSIARLLTQLGETTAASSAPAGSFVLTRLSETLQSFERLHGAT